ncbi:alpha/beta hydrolase [Pseudoduganella umbonata]|uniref:Acetyl esterase/lipase n=1 Tax=Pseudoduganella umbonata TaxID=864828 RepID=A0A4P8HM26_9BURK|nr:alpha/beta hydrolase [Pseudoduganella umbonata]MBB3219238.1 acetyl esterase/lipase [Pseudoduganella umbonata]QCP09358.1 alpha/beta hydrolase [Pseudoduganella umbonata]
MKLFPALLLGFACSAALAQQGSLPLWPDGAPGSEERRGEPETVKEGVYFSNVHDPSLTVARADPRHANGAAVIVVPGGGHRMLVFQNEGMAAAKNLNRVGVTAFVLKYRLARDGDSGYTIEGHGAADLRRAVRWVRTRAAEYGIDPARVGVMGFSAGGELVSLVADNPEPAGFVARDAVDRASARPDFQVLVYPGPLGVPARAVKGAPPAFLVAGSRDTCCMPPTVALYQQLVAAGVSAELHLYADTDHAFNVGQRGERISLQHWPDRLADWLADGGWLVPRGGRAPEGVPAP